jgi:cytoskeletal protein CcmA (bactofilin family)
MQINKKTGQEYEYDDSSTVTRVPAFEAPDPIARRPQQAEGERGQGEQPAAQPARRAESVIDADSVVDGRYEAGQDLRVLGTVSGELVCRGLLSIEKGATAKAGIQAHEAHIRGQVEGDIVCNGRLLLASTAVVNGTIKAGSLVVEEGAAMIGTIQTPLANTGANQAAAPTPIAAAQNEKGKPAAEGEAPAEGTRTTSGRWNNRTRDVPNFALVSSDERASTASDRN